MDDPKQIIAEMVHDFGDGPDLDGYGYRRSDQDGYLDGDPVSPREHKDEEFLSAARDLLAAEEVV